MNYGPTTDPACEPTWEEVAPEEYYAWVGLLTARRRAEILTDGTLMEGVKINAVTRSTQNEKEMDNLDDLLQIKQPWHREDAGALLVSLIQAQLEEAAESWAIDRAHEPEAPAEYLAWLRR